MSPPRFLLVLALLASLCGCGRGDHRSESASPGPASTPAVEVDVVPVRIATLADDIAVVGNFRAITEANISPKAGGLVVEVPVRLGQFVPTGAVLIQLDTEAIEAQLAHDRADIAAEQTRLGLRGLHESLRSDAQAPAVRKAKATLDNAQLQWERSRNLYRADLIAQKDLQDAKAQYLTALADYQTAIENVQTNKANVELKRSQLAIDEQSLRNATVRAPFAGWVAARNVDPGDYVQPGGASSNKEYIKLVTLDPIYCTMDIPEAYSHRLRTGQAVSIKTVSWPDRRFNGHITHISPSLDATTRTLKVDATLANPEKLLRPGLYGNVHLRLGQTPNAREVPQVAQVETAGQLRIFVVEVKGSQAVARALPITRGQYDGNWVQVREALSPSTRVIVSNTDKLYDGVPVKIGKTLSDAPPVASGGSGDAGP
jgi:membrane fusion protein (multidrug efflux system)